MADVNSILALTGLAVVGMAFAPQFRREIFKRDHGTCQCGNCITFDLTGKPFRWDDGFNVNAAHFPDLHQKAEDRDVSHGRILSVPCHIIEEIQRGNHQGVRLLYERQTIMNTGWLKTHNWRDVKPPLNLFYDLAENKPDAREAVVEFFGMALGQETALEK